uniref:Si:ch211-223p8.8 n=1 Tax=Seriola lalandi dorsalis TaxID=1841481 RepID=A0A3B4WKU9_SERLL
MSPSTVRPSGGPRRSASVRASRLGPSRRCWVESNTGDASEVRCDTQESDPEEEIKCTRATGDSQREIPSLQELEEVLYSAPRSCRHGDEVWPHLYLGDMFMSHDKFGLWQLGITHVLNAAHGKLCCKGSDDFYGTTVKYFGVPANDLPTFDLSPFFYPAAEFIHLALTSGGGVTCPSRKVFVHCAVGVSRSAALVLAYLMLHHRLTLLSSIRCVQEKRWIFPNRGFLRQLIALDRQLRDKGLNEPK